MFAFSHFFSSTEDAGLQQALLALPSFPDQLQHCLITGPARCGKTSLLLHYAYKLAFEGRRVLFICQRAKIEQVPPLLPPETDEVHPAFGEIDMRYLSTAADLRKYAACLHLLDRVPEAIIVDDISAFIEDGYPHLGKREREAQLMKTLAFLHECTSFASEKLSQDAAGGQRSCSLLVSDLATEGPQALFITRRWLPLIFVIRGTGPDYTLCRLEQGSQADDMTPASTPKICYHLAPFSAITLVDVRTAEREAQATATLR